VSKLSFAGFTVWLSTVCLNTTIENPWWGEVEEDKNVGQFELTATALLLNFY
jgi:hypothetical protein